MRSTLTKQERERFKVDGYLMAKNAVSREQLAKLQSEIKVWVDESRQHTKPYGEPTIDGRPRFDMGADHTALKPAGISFIETDHSGCSQMSKEEGQLVS